MTAVEVLGCGPSVLVEDLGRPGRAALGVGPSGAADRDALGLGNRLVGNAETAAGLEILLGGCRVLAVGGDLLVAVSGAEPPLDVDGTRVAPRSVVLLRAQQVLRLGTPATGLRTYLAVRGGIGVAPVLGSRSTDTLGGIGPGPVQAGDVLPVAAETVGFPLVGAVAGPAGVVSPVSVHVAPGPYDDLDRAHDLFGDWTVSGDSDRTGIRLEGPALRHDARRWPATGVVRGTVQLPPSGQPVVLFADHPVTGGYPVIGVVLDAEVDRLAQVRPGERVRLLEAPPNQLAAAAREKGVSLSRWTW